MVPPPVWCSIDPSSSSALVRPFRSTNERLRIMYRMIYHALYLPVLVCDDSKRARIIFLSIFGSSFCVLVGIVVAITGVCPELRGPPRFCCWNRHARKRSETYALLCEIAFVVVMGMRPSSVAPLIMCRARGRINKILCSCPWEVSSSWKGVFTPRYIEVSLSNALVLDCSWQYAAM